MTTPGVEEEQKKKREKEYRCPPPPKAGQTIVAAQSRRLRTFYRILSTLGMILEGEAD